MKLHFDANQAYQLEAARKAGVRGKGGTDKSGGSGKGPFDRLRMKKSSGKWGWEEKEVSGFKFLGIEKIFAVT